MSLKKETFSLSIMKMGPVVGSHKPVAEVGLMFVFVACFISFSLSGVSHILAYVFLPLTVLVSWTSLILYLGMGFHSCLQFVLVWFALKALSLNTKEYVDTDNSPNSLSKLINQMHVNF